MSNELTEEQWEEKLTAWLDRSVVVFKMRADILEHESASVPCSVSRPGLMLAHTMAIVSAAMLRIMADPKNSPHVMNALAVCMRRIAKSPEVRRDCAKRIAALDAMADELRRIWAI